MTDPDPQPLTRKQRLRARLLRRAPPGDEPPPSRPVPAGPRSTPPEPDANQWLRGEIDRRTLRRTHHGQRHPRLRRPRQGPVPRPAHGDRPETARPGEGGPGAAQAAPGPPPARRPHPALLANQAMEEAAWDIVRASGDIVLDTSAVTAARVAEASARDQAALLSTARDVANANVGQVVDRHAGAILELLQGRYAKVAAVVVPAVRRLPEGLTDRRRPSRIGGQTRTDWLAIEDGVAELALLRELVAEVGRQRET